MYLKWPNQTRQNLGLFVYIENILRMNSFIMRPVEQISVEILTGKFGGSGRLVNGWVVCDISVISQKLKVVSEYLLRIKLMSILPTDSHTALVMSVLRMWWYIKTISFSFLIFFTLITRLLDDVLVL